MTATKRAGSILPVLTPRSQMSAMRSWTPLTPLGILVKSFLPSSFCADTNVQWSVPVSCRSSLDQAQNCFNTNIRVLSFLEIGSLESVLLESSTVDSVSALCVGKKQSGGGSSSFLVPSNKSADLEDMQMSGDRVRKGANRSSLNCCSGCDEKGDGSQVNQGKCCIP